MIKRGAHTRKEKACRVAPGRHSGWAAGRLVFEGRQSHSPGSQMNGSSATGHATEGWLKSSR